MTEAEVWFQLYIGDDKKGDAGYYEIANLKVNRIAALKDAVYQKNAQTLAPYCENADHLVVYKQGAESPPKESDKMSGSQAVPLDTSDTDPLRIFSPDVLLGNRQGKQFSW
jgi:hypothetical protein